MRKIIGYTRSATYDSGMDSSMMKQFRATEAYGCTEIHGEWISGLTQQRRLLDRIIDDLEAGDELVVTEPSRLSRDYQLQLATIEQIKAKGAQVIFLSEVSHAR